MMRGASAALPLTAAALLAACGGRARLEPAPGADMLPAPREGARASAAGVTLTAEVDAWTGVPENLEQEVIPVLVTITNEGTRPLRIRYNEFRLEGAAGRRYAAIPPFDVRGTVSEPVDGFAYPYDGFAVAPYLRRWYPAFSPFDGAFALDPVYYDRYYPRFVRVRLPTGDMIQKALPEGVLAPGGRITGFLYFEELEGEERLVDFRFDLVDARSRRDFGTLSIPFVVR